MIDRKAHRGVYGGVADRTRRLDVETPVETPLPWVRVLRMAGALDDSAAGRLLTCVHRQLDGGAEHVVLDLSGTDLLTPAGLDALVAAREAASAADSELHLAGMLHAETIEPVHDRWLPGEFKIHRTTIEALAAISEWPGDGGYR